MEQAVAKPNGVNRLGLFVSGVKWEQKSVLALLPLIDCVLDCPALCCKESHPITVQEYEVERIAKRLEMRSGKLKRSLEPIGEWLWTLPRPCCFLKDNRCSIYEDRPVVCKYYPLQRVWLEKEGEYVVGVFTCWCDAGRRCIKKLMEWHNGKHLS